MQIQSWHTLKLAEVLKTLNTSEINGITNEKAEEIRKVSGFNELPPPKEKPAWKIFLEQIHNPIIYVLIGAMIIKILMKDPIDAAAILFVIIFNSLIGFFQELKANNAIKALRNYVSPIARVIRNGSKQEIPSRELVPGDIILLESGMRVPADSRLIETYSLRVDESMLTGESKNVTKKEDSVVEENSPLGDRFNIVYSGTIIQKGRGKAIVVTTGQQTEFGKISKSIEDTGMSKSPLQKRLEKFGKNLSLGSLVLITIIFIVGILKGYSIVDLFLTSVGLAVSAIPEGLPVAVTLTLSIGLYMMSKRKAIIRKLSAVETLGSTNIICSDKTGTLTRNQMTVTKIFSGDKLYNITGGGYNIEGDIISEQDSSKVEINIKSSLYPFYLISKFCTESAITKNENEFEITGDTTEGALMVLAEKSGFYDNKEWKYSVLVPFESERQSMAALIENNEEKLILWKGSVEKILSRCKTMINSEGEIVPLDVNKVLDKVADFSENGLRVLTLAYNKFDGKYDLDNLENTELIFAGISAIQDPPREEAIQAIHDCHTAGIKVVMITGDHVKTAKAIAKQLNIKSKSDDLVTLTGPEIDNLDEESLYKLVPEVDVYARVSPLHKLTIVKNLQTHGEIVSMTGDGVNDAPSLKQADIGVAMGSGSDVAKEVASMVILDNNFATIVAAIRQGRVIYQNLQHIILYLLTTSLGGVLTIATSVFLGFPLPILPLQLLWINIVTDGTSTIPLAVEKEHGNVMVKPPRKKNNNLISFTMGRRTILLAIIMMLGTLGVYYLSLPGNYSELNSESDLLRKSITLAFTTLAFFQIFNLQNSRSLDRSLFFTLKSNGEKLERVKFTDNLALQGVMLFAATLQVLAVELPILNTIMKTVPLTMDEWIRVILVSFSVIIVAEIDKLVSSLIKK